MSSQCRAHRQSPLSGLAVRDEPDFFEVCVASSSLMLCWVVMRDLHSRFSGGSRLRSDLVVNQIWYSCAREEDAAGAGDQFRPFSGGEGVKGPSALGQGMVWR